MHFYHYKNNELFVENVKLADVADQFGTPSYIYSHQQLENNWQAFESAFHQLSHRICYAVKANSNLAILHFFAKKKAGFDIVSIGELERVLLAGGDPAKIVFSGVAKRAFEIKRALEVNIGCFNIESLAELERIHQIAMEQKTIANVALRVNPDIDAKTHPHIATGLAANKFGIEYAEALALCKKIQTLPHLKLVGVGCHIGSQITELEPFLEALDKMLILVDKLTANGMTLQHMNIGGGLGIRYQNESPPSIQAYVTAIREKLMPYPLEIMLEPGRVLVGNTGILLTQIEYLKHTHEKHFAIVDAGMNDLLRPALYDAWHDIIPVHRSNVKEAYYDIVGPVCESADFLGKNRLLAINEGDLLAITTAGAYGFAMSSNYNSRPRPAEIWIDDKEVICIRKRESIEDLVRGEVPGLSIF